ncbi:MAG: sodium dependent phosphate transporter [Acidobacteria bacterium]|nr:sodium dependent phosphate transporter [Acidobacteriota bacterium]
MVPFIFRSGDLTSTTSWSRGITVATLLFGFLVGVKALGEGFQLLGEATLDQIFSATTNPYISLVVGILATTIMQSSSVTTSMIVGLVAAPESPLPLANAVPMIMGANIGTTVTATVVSLAHIGRSNEFERAFPIAVCHDLFNYLTVAVLLPLELLTGYLRRAAIAMSRFMVDVGGVDYESPIATAIAAVLALIEQVFQLLFVSVRVQGMGLIVFGGVVIFVTLFFIVKVMRSLVRTRIERMVSEVLGSNAIFSILVGIVVTAMVQSSSITTSLLVPLGAAGLLRLEQALPITIGANVGTTVTALFAALAGSGANRIFGLEIAMVHLLFNLTGLVLIYPFSVTRNIPLRLARFLTTLALRSPRLTLFWVIALFYGVPTLLLVVDRAIG